MNWLFDKIVYYSPVFVPLMLVVFSVIVRVLSGTMQPTRRNFLKTYNDIVLGIFSFLIWGLITYMQANKITLNSDLEISFSKFLILLILDLIFLVFAAFISRYDWNTSTSNGNAKEAAGNVKDAAKKERHVDSLMIVLALFLFFVPVGLTTTRSEPPKEAEKAPKQEPYTVIVPYDDAWVQKQAGIGRWAGRHVCDIVQVKALNQKEATDSALAIFDQSGHKETVRKVPNVKGTTLLRDYVMARSEK